MKIDTDLRLAIKSAERAQPTNDWQEIRKEEQEAIAAFLKSNPARARAIAASIKTVKDLKSKIDAIRKKMCEKYGLRIDEDREQKLDFANCGSGRETFEKAGGRKRAQKYTRWKFDDVMRKLSAASPKEGAAIIKSLGINWE